MKTKKFKSKQFLKLHLLKSRVYEYPIKKTNFNDLKNVNLDQILIGVRKALQVILQYNQTSRRILFIGLPSNLKFKINSLTRHTAVSNSFNIQGIISNNKSNLLLNLKNSTKKSVKQNPALLLLKSMKIPDLVILFDHEKSHTVLSEAWTAKIPVIAFTDNNTNSNNWMFQNSYFINGNFKSILTAFDKNIFFTSLNFLFKNLKKKLKPLSVLPKSKSYVTSKRRKKL